MRKPFYRRDRGCWFVKTPDGNNQLRLHEDEAEAYRLWQEMMVAARPELPNAPLVSIAESFLRYSAPRVASTTYSGYAYYLASFCDNYGTTRVRDLKPFHVTRWIEAKSTWGVASQRQAIITVKRCLNWAVQEGLLNQNPLVGVRKPKGRRRETLINDEQHAAMMQVEDGGRRPGKRASKLKLKPRRRDACFRQVLMALKHSGARPGSVAAVRVEDVAPDLSAWILQQHKNRHKTGAPLIIYLSPCLQTLTRLAMGARTSGPLFLNSRGQAWTSNAIRCRMHELREKLSLPKGMVAYAYRHSYATRALVNGTDLATVAELLGHGDLKMLAQHYGHLDKQKDHLKRAAALAIRRPK